MKDILKQIIRKHKEKPPTEFWEEKANFATEVLNELIGKMAGLDTKGNIRDKLRSPKAQIVFNFIDGITELLFTTEKLQQDTLEALISSDYSVIRPALPSDIDGYASRVRNIDTACDIWYTAQRMWGGGGAATPAQRRGPRPLREGQGPRNPLRPY